MAPNTGLAANPVPISDQSDSESEHNRTDPELSTDGAELAVLNGNDSPSHHDRCHDHHECEHRPPSFHIGTEATASVNRSLVVGQNWS